MASSSEQEFSLRQEFEKQPDSVRAMTRLATWLRQQGRQIEALDVLEKGISIASRHVHLVTMHIQLLSESGRLNDAVKAAVSAVELAPDSVELRMLACRAQLANLEPELAQEHLDVAMGLQAQLHQLERMRNLQRRINSLSGMAEHNPFAWFLRKFNRRIANVAKERKEE